MSDLSSKVPEHAIVMAFVGVIAISPEIYKRVVGSLAEKFKVPRNDAFLQYVSDVLKRQPQEDFD